MYKFFPILMIGLMTMNCFSQVASQDTSGMGVAVSPSSFHLSIKPGKTEAREVLVNNDSKKTIKFNVSLTDFEMGENGKVVLVKSGESKFTLSKWTSVSPSYIELAAGERKKIKLIFTIPDSAFFSAWSMLTIDEVDDKKPLDLQGTDKTIAFGVTNTMGFGVYLYQNPPHITDNNINIVKFDYVVKDSLKSIFTLSVKNVGEGIGYSTAYVELTNLNNGKISKLNTKRFTLLPKYNRNLGFDVPTTIEKGKYSAVGVLDFGSKEEIKAAELELEIK